MSDVAGAGNAQYVALGGVFRARLASSENEQLQKLYGDLQRADSATRVWSDAIHPKGYKTLSGETKYMHGISFSDDSSLYDALQRGLEISEERLKQQIDAGFTKQADRKFSEMMARKRKENRKAFDDAQSARALARSKAKLAANDAYLSAVLGINKQKTAKSKYSSLYQPSDLYVFGPTSGADADYINDYKYVDSLNNEFVGFASFAWEDNGEAKTKVEVSQLQQTFAAYPPGIDNIRYVVRLSGDGLIDLDAEAGQALPPPSGALQYTDDNGVVQTIAGSEVRELSETEYNTLQYIADFTQRPTVISGESGFESKRIHDYLSIMVVGDGASGRKVRGDVSKISLTRGTLKQTPSPSGDKEYKLVALGPSSSYFNSVKLLVEGDFGGGNETFMSAYLADPPKIEFFARELGADTRLYLDTSSSSGNMLALTKESSRLLSDGMEIFITIKEEVREEINITKVSFVSNGARDVGRPESLDAPSASLRDDTSPAQVQNTSDAPVVDLGLLDRHEDTRVQYAYTAVFEDGTESVVDWTDANVTIDLLGNSSFTLPVEGQSKVLFHDVRFRQINTNNETLPPVEVISPETNLGLITWDISAPRLLSINIDDDQLSKGETANVTFVFDEEVNEVDVLDFEVDNGTLSGFQKSSNDPHIWLATFTPDDDVEDLDVNSIHVSANATFEDIAGNQNNTNQSAAASPNYRIDTKLPTLESIEISDTLLTRGETATVTFTFSEYVDLNDVDHFDVPNGEISNFTAVQGTDQKQWTATFTPTEDIEDPNNVIQHLEANLAIFDEFSNAVDPTVAVDTENYAVDTNIDIEINTGQIESDDVVNTAESTALSLNGTTSGVEDDQVVTVTFADEGGSTVTASATVTNGAWALEDANISTLNDGAITISSTVQDSAGNTATSERPITLDTQASIDIDPALIESDDVVNTAESTALSLNGTTSGVEDDQVVTVTFADEGGSTVTASATVTNGAWALEDANISTLSDGAITISSTVQDSAGNTATSERPITLDTQVAAPSMTIDDQGASTIDGVTNVNELSVTLEAGATFEYSTDSGASWTSGSGNSFTLADGEYDPNTIQVRQTDAAGNTSTETLYPDAIIIDTQKPDSPQIAIDPQSNNIFNVTLEAGATFEYSTDSGASWTSGSGNSFTLANGEYDPNTIQVRQIDVAGNISTEYIYPDKIDTLAPSALVISSIDGTTSSDGSVTTYTQTNANDRVNYLLPTETDVSQIQYYDSVQGAWQDAGSDGTLELPTGTYENFQMRVVDNSGNISPLTTTFNGENITIARS